MCSVKTDLSDNTYDARIWHVDGYQNKYGKKKTKNGDKEMSWKQHMIIFLFFFWGEGAKQKEAN